jgi:Spy/CpxP family protein refolding chaperone
METAMLRPFTTVALLAAAVPTLFAAGCASNNAKAPYSLTGDTQVTAEQRHADWVQRQRFTDDKGRYRADLAAADIPQR